MPIRSRADAASRVRLLLVDRDPEGGVLLRDALSGCLAAPLDIEQAEGGRQAAELLRLGTYELVLIDLSAILDMALPTEDAVARLVRLAEGALTIAISEDGSVSAAVAAMRAGAHDFVARPISGPAFAVRIGELAQRHGKARALAVRAGGSHADGFAGFIGSSSQMQFVYEQIERTAPSSAPVFITGESGTGKELCAEALHDLGPRAGRRFVAIDCIAVPRGVLEAELFGVARGAVTSANEDRAGAIEIAGGGTLFLDEIGGMDLSLQSKLLSFLQTGAFTRVGDATLRQADVRVICSTSRNPMQLIAEKAFREDLFYRLHVLPIHLPPLRQRPTDIPVLARHFLAHFAREERKEIAGLSAEAADVLAARTWPGNVRELQNFMRRLAVMADGGEIDVATLAAADVEALAAPPAAATPFQRQPILPMWRQEQRIIEEAIERCSGNVALAAAALELSPSTIYRKRQAWAEMEGKRGAA